MPRHALFVLIGVVAASGIVSAADPVPPWVAGFERRHRDGTDPVAGGFLLLGELGCTACHDPGRLGSRRILHKRAPRLEKVAERCDPYALRELVLDPASTHPGTTMPGTVGRIPPGFRGDAADALVHFLVSKARKPFVRTAPDLAAAERGESTFHDVGCVACHPPQRDAAALSGKPFPDLAAKYSVDGLRRFLENPLATRPAGRMPHMTLSGREASDIAHYLLRRTEVGGTLSYEVWHGHRRRWNDTRRLQRERTGIADGFDLAVLRRRGDVTLKLSGFLHIKAGAEYSFHLTADDMGRLRIDDALLIDIDKAEKRRKPREKSATIHLDAGWHAIAVDFFQWRDDAVLRLEWEGPGTPRGPIPRDSLRSTREPLEPDPPWALSPTLAAEGGKLFRTLGCQACHGIDEAFEPPSTSPRPLGSLDPDAEYGCLSNEDSSTHPSYWLDDAQVNALRRALRSISAGGLGLPTTTQRLDQSIATFDCAACHVRDGIGEIPDDRQEYFTSSEPDLGDEARIPPPLDGVGDKLTPAWLETVMVNRGRARPYMKTRMPQYGEANVGHFAEAFVALDRKKRSLPNNPDDLAAQRLAGRDLVDSGKLQCIVCHTFNRQPAVGMQALDLATMPQRLNRDWFHEYMLDPEALRPGTLMLNMWPDGESPFEDILDGDPFRQVDAIWHYLADGEKAVFPKGLSRLSKELIVGGEPILYRGKLWQAGFRGIAVGYPERVNVAFDAEETRLALIWRGRFLNVGGHWGVQGMGRIRPLGRDVRVLPEGPPLAVLDDADAPWPEAAGKDDPRFRFGGYEFDAKRHPKFFYSFGESQIEERFRGDDSGPTRIVRSVSTRGGGDVWLRLWTGDEIASRDGAFDCDDRLRVRVSGGTPRIVTRHGPAELRVKLQPGATLEVEYSW